MLCAAQTCSAPSVVGSPCIAGSEQEPEDEHTTRHMCKEATGQAPPTSAGRGAQALRICTSGGETLVMQWAMSGSVMHQTAAVGRQAACSPSRKRSQETNRRKPTPKPKKKNSNMPDLDTHQAAPGICWAALR